LDSAPGNTLRAADFYRILITQLKIILVADAQSPGGKAVWAKLNKFPDVSIHGWLKGKPVNITPDDDEYAYGTYQDLLIRGNRDNENTDALNMKLVAYHDPEKKKTK
jgi:hypothetical protein